MYQISINWKTNSPYGESELRALRAAVFALVNEFDEDDYADGSLTIDYSDTNDDPKPIELTEEQELEIVRKHINGGTLTVTVQIDSADAKNELINETYGIEIGELGE